ncbi:MAG: hypothetical protein IT376_03085 [Polyangiaceae bacterium]|nr:hypothetical protein [Polyangiaceae bacterium]
MHRVSRRAAVVLGFVLVTSGCGDRGAAPGDADASPPASAAAAHVSDAARRAAATIRELAPAPPDVATLEPDAGRLRGVVAANVEPTARVWLPRSADGAFRIEDARSGASVEVRRVGVAPAAAEVDADHAAYLGALGEGSSVVQRADARGTEDYVTLARPPAAERLAYVVELERGVAGLRQVDAVVELLDASGAPRLRALAPWVMDARGERRAASIRVVDCAADRSPAAPWGRPVTPPGKGSCTVEVSWPAGLEYPLVVDPVWQATDSLATARAAHGAVLLADGLALITGGFSLSGPGFVVSSCELYDRVSGTFAATYALATGRWDHSTTLLSDGQVLVAGGSSSTSVVQTSAERYDPGTGKWSSAGSFAGTRRQHVAAPFSGGRVLIAGGYDTSSTATMTATTAIYTESSNSWVAGPSMSAARAGAAATWMPAAGRVLVTGGIGPSDYLDSAELYTPSAGIGSWASAGTFAFKRSHHTSTLLPNGSVAILGGQTTASAVTSILNYAYGTGFTTAGNLSSARYSHTATLRPQDGKVFVSGGCSGSGILTTAELYDPGSTLSPSVGSMSSRRMLHAAVALANGDILMAGGATTSSCGYGSSAGADLYVERGDGQACTATNQCLTGFCVDGVCCDEACTGGCRACTAAKKGGGADGACGDVQAGTDPDSDCPNDGAATCDRSGVCDGAGACQLYAAATSCQPNSCSGTTLTSYACDGLGTCQSSTVSCSPYNCLNTSACRTSCTLTSHCVASSYCDTTDSQCKADQANGAACTAGDQCVSGHCADGYCCDQLCDEGCKACSSAKKGAGANGVCGNIVAGSDPDGDCPDDGAAGCDRNGACNGAGACQLYAAGTACGASTCSGGTQTGYGCDGFGTCSPSNTTQCHPYVCAGTTCGASCASNNDCVSSYHCAGTTCTPDKSIGQTCGGAAECTSGNCVDGRCCDGPCTGTCQACSNAKTGQPNGQCASVTADTDPDSECADQGASGCGFNGTCSGVGSCGYYASGTACGTTTCTSGTQTGSSCDGAGACVPSQTTPCAPYVCSGNACGTSCADDAGCVASAYCSSANACTPDEANGVACTKDSMCTSGNCVDGFCCDQLCDGLCEACSAAKKGGGADGACGAVVSGDDPDNDCAADLPETCGQTGACDGARACAKWGTSTACGSGTVCTDTLTVTGRLCDGFGACVDGQSSSCAPYLCTGTTCSASCTGQSDCAPGHYCAGSTCVAKVTDGTACSAALECASGFCVDGVCCDTACNGTCQSCAAATKTTGADGACGPAQEGEDPHDDCPDDGAPSCDRNGLCDGAGQCQVYANGAPCGLTTCQGNTQTGFSCDGAGTCNAQSQVDCGLYACLGSSCRSTCAVDDDCAGAAFCEATSGTCTQKRPNGETCTEARTCSSGNCVDGVCCDASCDGQCEACDVATKLGTCSPINGAPHGARVACPGAAGGDPCEARTCDGTKSTTTCAGFVGIEVECRAESCAGGVETSGATCDGTGVCPAERTKECEPYACGATACLTRCAADAECRGGARCEVATGRCVSGATCDGDHTVTGVDGTTTDCSPYLCSADGSCKASCTVTEDCVTGFVCDTGTSTCVATGGGAAAADDGGCGCRVPGSPAPGRAGWLALVGIAALAARRRRGGASRSR